MPTILIDRLATDPHQTEFGIREDTSSRGVDLAGALITATYTDGTFEELVWQAFDPFTFGGFNGVDISTTFGFDLHELSTTKRLASLEMDLTPASSVFDTTTAMDDDPNGGSTLTSKNGISPTIRNNTRPRPNSRPPANVAKLKRHQILKLRKPCFEKY